MKLKSIQKRQTQSGGQSQLLYTGHPLEAHKVCSCTLAHAKITGIQNVKVDCVHPLQGGGSFMSAPGGRTEIFDFEAGDASEARVYIRAILGGGWTSPL